uniref:Uncharacterized protein n=1 Tax=Chromera velia CCMP2878 TaxID=1169474 RepID=A0A0G4H8B5_9ALVE|eukprot:Cvel_863.t1-p1 / transcript=Cvel_863.t1 / gene=Cvel_863 / organism=Chromera_velia_CCMP2878 / gene_product=hypothetical protein / transcript_product=hypothetical protein / location=Cvel_scaffold27:50331-50993(+) / protein_length=186 / sequence_SO=supercontig / SO=protein_coding / is_pseudo=false
MSSTTRQSKSAAWTRTWSSIWVGSPAGVSSGSGSAFCWKAGGDTTASGRRGGDGANVLVGLLLRRDSPKQTETGDSEGDRPPMGSPYRLALSFLPVPLADPEKGKGETEPLLFPPVDADSGLSLFPSCDCSTSGVYMEKKNVDPLPGPPDSTPTLPPQWASTNILEMHRPKPVPPPLCSSPALIWL